MDINSQAVDPGKGSFGKLGKGSAKRQGSWKCLMLWSPKTTMTEKDTSGNVYRKERWTCDTNAIR